MISFSPGLIQGCFELLAIINRQQLTLTEINQSFAYLGSMPAQKILETAQALNWVKASEKGFAQHTYSGRRLLDMTGYEAQLRQALLDYIDVEHPSWIQNASFGRSRVISFAGSQIAQVFAEAGLADGTSESVVSFWDTLAARARGKRDDRLAQIGRLGERLTIDYESQRTGHIPTWVAIDNNADGYDVLSIMGSTNPQKLTIEVKTSTQGLAGSAMLTRHEWEMAIEAECHAFYLWNLEDSSKPMLAIVSGGEMLQHIPHDQGVGEWDCTKIAFSAFIEAFTNTNQ